MGGALRRISESPHPTPIEGSRKPIEERKQSCLSSQGAKSLPGLNTFFQSYLFNLASSYFLSFSQCVLTRTYTVSRSPSKHNVFLFSCCSIFKDQVLTSCKLSYYTTSFKKCQEFFQDFFKKISIYLFCRKIPFISYNNLSIL